MQASCRDRELRHDQSIARPRREEFPPSKGLGMSQALQIIDELEVALKGNSTERHLSILKSVTGLFLAGHDRLTEEVSSVFDGVMVRLIEHVESLSLIHI